MVLKEKCAPGFNLVPLFGPNNSSLELATWISRNGINPYLSQARIVQA